MKFHVVRSTNLWLVGWDGNRLHVVFRDCETSEAIRVYSYDVHPNVVIEMLLAESIGSYFAKHIRGLPFEKRVHSRSRLLETT
jgi:hypothetical protein